MYWDWDLIWSIYYAVCAGLFGLVIGSFLNVCIFRLPNEESIAFPASHCMECGHKLGFWDLIPLFSYIFLGGKCRYCKTRISPQYPIVEALNMGMYLFGMYKFGPGLQFVFFALLSSLLIVLTFTDFRHMTMPTIVLALVFVVGILYMLLSKKLYLDSLWGFLAGGGFFLLLYVITRFRGVGEGDIMLMAALGVWLGLKCTILAALFAFIIGAFASVAVLIKNGGEKKTMVPFGPFIAIGSMIAFLWGSEIISWYLGFFEHI